MNVLVFIEICTRFHVMAVLCSKICQISQYYYHAIVTFYLLVGISTNTQAVAVRKIYGKFRLHFFRSQVYMIS